MIEVAAAEGARHGPGRLFLLGEKTPVMRACERGPCRQAERLEEKPGRGAPKES